MTSPVRSVNVDHVNRLMEAIRIGGEFKVEKLLRVASDIGGYVPETDPRYQPGGWTGASDDIKRLKWVSRSEGSGSRSPVRSSPCTRLPVSRRSICWPFWRPFAKVSRWIWISGSGMIRSGTGRLSVGR